MTVTVGPVGDDELAAFLPFVEEGDVRYRSRAHEEVAVTMGKDLA